LADSLAERTGAVSYLAQTWILSIIRSPTMIASANTRNTMMSGMLIGFPFFLGEGFFELKVKREKTIPLSVALPGLPS